MDIITSHLNADFDSLASMLAAKKLYPQADVVFPGSQERKVRDFIEVFHPIPLKRFREIDLAKVERLVIVDTKQPDRIGRFGELLADGKVKVHIYDHHPAEPGDIRGETELIEDVGATATLFVELLREKRLEPSPMEATVLALGIYEETGSLLFPSTTERDMLAAAYLLRRGANLNIVASYLRTELNTAEIDLLNELIKSSKEVVVRGLRIIVARASRDSYVGDAAHLAHRIMDLEDIDAVIVLLNMEGKILIIGRSRAPELDISELLRDFGGGGHRFAASATVREASADILADRILDALPDHVRPGKVAADVMTHPVITIPAESSVSDAEDRMTKYGVNVLPIVRNSAFAGLISRETVEKALFHGFRKNRVTDFATSDALSAEPDTPLRDVETMMIENNQRFMPVVRERKIIGAITRTDLLRVLYEEFLRRRKIGREGISEIHGSSRSLASWMRDRFPEQVYGVLKLSGEIAERMGVQAYLVGGSVRDLLLGQTNLDIDLVIEGDGIAFAQELGRRLGGRVRPHKRFGTAHVVTDTIHLDVATARTEYYESPAALPKVKTSSIKKDLYRRDFTINALAVRLNAPDFGMLIDFFGGQRDIREKTIRVLHNLSFVEDPTRAFRAVRFSERFGFKLSRHTEALIKSAIQMNLFERLSGSRLYDELHLAFEETSPAKTLKRLADYGLLRVIHQAIVFDATLERAFSATAETIAWYSLSFIAEPVDTGMLYLMTLLSGLSEEERAEALRRLNVPPRVQTTIQEGIASAADLIKRLPVSDPARLYRLLNGAGMESLLFAMSTTRDTEKKKAISLYLSDLRKVKPLLTGADLKALQIPAGPLYATILRSVLDEKLRGSLRTKEDEREFVIRRFLPR
ncbi:MAG: CBS domain-containing protein [Thermodesulfovibrionales bacterium]